MISEAELGYIAALIDTMGCLRVRHAATELPMITISSTNEDLLGYLAKVTGTGLVVSKRNYYRHNCTEHCKEAHQQVISMNRRWQATGVRATMILDAIAPYVRMQREEVEHLRATGLQANYKRTTVAAMAKLGWPVPLRWDDVEVA